MVEETTKDDVPQQFQQLTARSWPKKKDTKKRYRGPLAIEREKKAREARVAKEEEIAQLKLEEKRRIEANLAKQKEMEDAGMIPGKCFVNTPEGEGLLLFLNAMKGRGKATCRLSNRRRTFDFDQISFSKGYTNIITSKR